MFFSSKWDFSRQPRQSSFPLNYVQTVSYTHSTPPLDDVQLRNLSILFDTTAATSTVAINDLIPTGALLRPLTCGLRCNAVSCSAGSVLDGFGSFRKR